MVKEVRSKKKEILKISIFIGLLIIVSYIIYSVLVYVPICENDSCFRNSLKKCNKATYIKDDDKKTIKYDIIGSSGTRCITKVKILQIKKGQNDLSNLEGKEMECRIPLGSIEDPDASLNDCHGRLREEVQEVIVQRLYSQIVENIGEISREYLNLSEIVK